MTFVHIWSRLRKVIVTIKKKQMQFLEDLDQLTISGN